ncbi:MAG: hypothetical protein CSB16_01610 [Clostridiales bacterium]|nr:MAG: hypothetical protein CSB16_01610 [Clostridiales bacterium]
MGLGIDIVYVPRIARLIEENDRFINRYFSDEEKVLFIKRSYSPEVVASNYASKEAFLKATKKEDVFDLRDMCILRHDSGEPYIEFKNKKLELKYKDRIDISISHDNEYVISVVTVG